MSKVFTFVSEYFKVHPVKASCISIPPLVLIIGTVQEKLGILPKRIVYSKGVDIVTDPDFGFYTSPK